jgi:hypothetical protein
VPNAGGNVNDIFWKRKWLHSRAEIRRSNIQARVRGHLPDPPGKSPWRASQGWSARDSSSVEEFC